VAQEYEIVGFICESALEDCGHRRKSHTVNDFLHESNRASVDRSPIIEAHSLAVALVIFINKSWRIKAKESMVCEFEAFVCWPEARGVERT